MPFGNSYGYDQINIETPWEHIDSNEIIINNLYKTNAELEKKYLASIKELRRQKLEQQKRLMPSNYSAEGKYRSNLATDISRNIENYETNKPNYKGSQHFPEIYGYPHFSKKPGCSRCRKCSGCINCFGCRDCNVPMDVAGNNPPTQSKEGFSGNPHLQQHKEKDQNEDIKNMFILFLVVVLIVSCVSNIFENFKASPILVVAKTKFPKETIVEENSTS